MNIGHWSLSFILVFLLDGIPPVLGDIIFSQDFASSGSVSACVDLLDPDQGQWNSIAGGAIADGGLSFTRGTAFRGFTRSSDFAPAPEALIYKFDVNVIAPTTKTKDAAVWQVGSAFSPTLNGRESASKVHSQFAINFNDLYGGFTFRDPNTATDYTSKTFGRKFGITWVINNSGETMQYTAPNDSLRIIANNEWDLWCGTDSVFLGRDATTPDRPITDLKFAYTSGSGTIWMDNFSIESLGAVPEPESTGVAAAAFLVLFAMAWRFRVRGAKQTVEPRRAVVGREGK